MKVFGLTGNIASGKSSVARAFKRRGVTVVDADQVSHDVTAFATDGLAALVAAFGHGILQANGELDRKRLGSLVFSNKDARAILNSIVHPRVAAETKRRFEELSGFSLVCYDAALLVENHMQDAFRPLVIVTVPEELQIQRLMDRNGLTLDEANARISSQMPQATKALAADFIIHNDSDLATLEIRATHVLEKVGRRLDILDMLL